MTLIDWEVAEEFTREYEWYTPSFDRIRKVLRDIVSCIEGGLKDGTVAVNKATLVIEAITIEGTLEGRITCKDKELVEGFFKALREI